MIDKLLQLKDKILKELSENVPTSLDELQALEIKYLGRKGELTGVLRGIKDLADDQKREFGRIANEIKGDIEAQFAQLYNALRAGAGLGSEQALDVTLPGKPPVLGTLHPITQMEQLIWETFERLNFEVASGPEIETDYYCFEALNMPPNHPARDMQETFYTDDSLVLRTHTSNMQVRVMEKSQGPLRVITTGKCYRRDSDLTHTPMFHQFEGFMVDKDITMAHLKSILQTAMGKLFGKEISVRFRISYFPFVEPGAEFDVSCTLCDGKGCPTCKHTGWLEMGGCGMIHPHVLKAGGYDPDEWQGFAFGFGIERPLMIKHKIPDLRLMFENDIRFLEQF